MLFDNIKKYASSLGHQLSAKEEILLIGIEKEVNAIVFALIERVANLEDINKLALPKAKFIQQKLQGNKLNLKDDEESKE